MARVKVRMFATVREAAGCPEVELEVSSLQELLESLGERLGPGVAEAVSGALEGSDGLVILVNGHNVRPGRGRHIPLRDGDEVALFPPVSGG